MARPKNSKRSEERDRYSPTAPMVPILGASVRHLGEVEPAQTRGLTRWARNSVLGIKR